MSLSGRVCVAFFTFLKGREFFKNNFVLSRLCKLFAKALAMLIFATFGIAKTSFALLSLIAKIGLSVGLCGFGNVLAIDGF
jgi:hypothetical protein